MVRHLNLKEGLYDLAFQFQVSVGGVGPTPETIMPGAMFGVAGIGLARSLVVGANTVDAAKLQPLKARKTSKAK